MRKGIVIVVAAAVLGATVLLLPRIRPVGFDDSE